MKGVINRLRLLVQFVTNVVIDDDGNATCEGADGEQLAPSVGYHFGFYSRPTRSRGVVLKADGQGNTSFLIAFRNKQYEMTLSKGEVGIKNEFDASILLDKNGIVNLNGSDYDAPRWNDFLSDFSTFITNLGTDLAAGSASGVTTTSTTGIADALAEGWKSAKVKNG